MCRRWIAACTAVAGLVLVAGCGGGGGGGGTSPPPGTRTATLNTLGAQFAALEAADPATSRQKLATWLQTRPEFEASGTAPDGSVWARFSDGRLVIVPVMKVPDPNRAVDVPTVPKARGRAGTTPSNLPFDGPAFVGNAMGPLFHEWCANYRIWLRGANYNVVDTATTVEGLKAVQGAGLFYINCHFGQGQERSGWPQRC